MLTIVVLGDEVYDESVNEFSTIGDVTLDLEHSLVSLSKWESEFEKPFLGKGEKTPEEMLAYIKCMVLTPDVSDEVFGKFTEDNFDQINTYINRRMSATRFYEVPGSVSQTTQVITSELIYYWMSAFGIKWEAQHWHLNRLLTLIKVASLKQEKPKKMSQRQILRQNADINARRRAELNTKG